MMRTRSSVSSRRGELDALRGLTLISMILYHACWDLYNLFGCAMPWFHSAGAFYWQQSICCSFILLSGYCLSLGHHPYRRALALFLGGLVISAVTYFLMPDAFIFFGVLSLLGSAMFLTAVASPLLRKADARIGLLLVLILFALTYRVSVGYLGFPGCSVALPQKCYVNLLTACFGFPPAGFVSADYFPLLPWLFLYLAGFFLYRLYPKPFTALPQIKPLAFLGRHSFPIYLLHQPLLYGVLFLVFNA